MAGSHSSTMDSPRRMYIMLLIAGLVFSSPQPTSTCAVVDKMSLQLSWVNSPEFAGFVVPGSGFSGIPQYSEECLEVQVREGGPLYDPLQELADDKVDMALCEGSYVAEQVGKGKDYVIVASFYQLSSLALVGLQKTVLSSLQDLSARTVGLRRFGYDLTVKLMLKNAGVVPTFVNQSAASLSSIRPGQATVDVATSTLYRDLGEVLQWLNPSTRFLMQEEDLAIFNTADYSAPALHNVLVVKKSRLSTLRPKLVKLLKVVARAWVYCRDHEDTCMAAGWPYASPMQHRLLRETLKLIFPSPSFGVLSDSTWANVHDTLALSGLIPSRTTSYRVNDNSLIVEAVQAVDFVGTTSTQTTSSMTTSSMTTSTKTTATATPTTATATSTTSTSTNNTATADTNATMSTRTSTTTTSTTTSTTTTVTPSALAIAAAAVYNPRSLKLCAPYNSQVPLRICVGEEHTLCQQGYVPPPGRGGSCVACAPGRFSVNAWTAGPSRMNTCQLCPAGRYTVASGQKQCKACQTGMFRSSNSGDYSASTLSSAFAVPNSSSVATTMSNQSALFAYLTGTRCAWCEPGRVAPSTGMGVCDFCPGGHVAKSSGSTACESCPDGSYASSLGSSLCTACLSNTTTRGDGATHAYECACAPGLFRAADGACSPCPAGFECPVGSDEAVLRSWATSGYVNGQYPHLLPGYWSSRADPLSVYVCSSQDFCPGGAPQSCGLHMDDIACSLCEKGYFRQGQKCESCTSVDSGEFNYPTLPAIGGPILAFVMYYTMWDKVEKWGSVVNELWSLAFLVVVHFQIVGVVVTSNVPWPSQMYSTLYVWEYFVDIVDMLRLDCIADSNNYRGFNGYIVKAMAPVLLLAFFGLLWVTGIALAECGACVRKSGGHWLDATFKSCGMSRFTRGDPKFAVDSSVLFNAYMAILQAFYIPFCFISLELFMCYEHPNGKKTLRFGTSVECDGPQWQQSAGESIIIMIPVCAGVVTAIIMAAIGAPKYFNDSGFRSRWKFLLIKWRPDVWWWGVVVLIRALLLCLTHIVSQEGQRQLLWQLAILLAYFGCAAVLRPWRSMCATILDLEVCGSLILFIALSCNFVTRSGWLDDSVAMLGCIASFIPAAVYALTAMWVVCLGVDKQSIRGPADLELADSTKAAFAKFVSMDKNAAEAFVMKLTDQDAEALRHIWFVLAVELLKEPCGSRHFEWLVRKETASWRNAFRPPPGRQPPVEDLNPEMVDDIGEDDVDESQWGLCPPNCHPPIAASRAGEKSAHPRNPSKRPEPASPRTPRRLGPNEKATLDSFAIGSFVEVNTSTPEELKFMQGKVIAKHGERVCVEFFDAGIEYMMPSDLIPVEVGTSGENTLQTSSSMRGTSSMFVNSASEYGEALAETVQHAFPMGTIVEAHSLSSSSGFNGKLGKVIGYLLRENGEYVRVSFGETIGIKAVKPDNLRFVEAANWASCAFLRSLSTRDTMLHVGDEVTYRRFDGCKILKLYDDGSIDVSIAGQDKKRAAPGEWKPKAVKLPVRRDPSTSSTVVDAEGANLLAKADSSSRADVTSQRQIDSMYVNHNPSHSSQVTFTGPVGGNQPSVGTEAIDSPRANMDAKTSLVSDDGRPGPMNSMYTCRPGTQQEKNGAGIGQVQAAPAPRVVVATEKKRTGR